MAKLLAASRSHGASLTSLLHALILVSLSLRLPSDVAPSFQMTTPINLRPYVSAESSFEATENFHVLVTGHHFKSGKAVCADIRKHATQSSSAEPLDKVIWATSKLIRQSLIKKTGTLPADDVMGLMRFAGDFHERWQKQHGTQREATWEVSNLGSIAGRADCSTDWEAIRLIFSQADSLAGSLFDVNVAGITDGELSVTLTTNEGAVEDSLLAGLFDDLKGWTENLAKSGSFCIDPADLVR